MKLLFRRPVLLLITAIIMLVYCALEYNLVLPIFFSFFAIGMGNFFGSAMSFIQLLFGIITSPGILSAGILYLLGAVIVVALVGALVFGGFFNIIRNVLEKKPMFKGEFILGIRKYFVKLFTINLRIELLSILFFVFIMLVCVPAIAATRAASQGKSGFYAGAALVDVITVCVVFFALLFYRIYIFFWYPAALKFPNKTFSNGKRIADEHFWYIAKKVVIFDLIFIVIGGLLLAGKLALMHDQNMNAGLMYALLALDWIFKTIFFGTFVIFIFSFFKTHGETSEEEHVEQAEN